MSSLIVPPSYFRAWQEFSYPLSQFSTFGAGGIGKNVFFPRSLEELTQSWDWAMQSKLPVVVVGNGSNLLFPDGEYFNPIICVKRLNNLIVDDNIVFAQCGVTLSKLVKTSAQHALSGLEFAIDIPGCVGGSVMGNAGAYGSDMFKRLHNIEYLDETGKRGNSEVGEFDCGYRSSGINPKWCILGASFQLQRDCSDNIYAKIKLNQQNRRQNQPHGSGTAGSIFKNPNGKSAWQLIEACGLKGFRKSAVGISQKHANWIVNYGGATSVQIVELIDYIKKVVLDKQGVLLEAEVRLVT